MNLQQISRLPGIADPALLRAAVRLRIGHKEPRQLVTFKVYEEATGGFTAIPSHVPLAPSKPGLAPKPLQKSGKAPAPTRSPLSGSRPSPEGAIEHAVLTLLLQADRLAAKEWGPNPDY
ncbi:hypothetical protein D3C86_1392190 [compost metagenome]